MNYSPSDLNWSCARWSWGHQLYAFGSHPLFGCQCWAHSHLNASTFLFNLYFIYPFRQKPCRFTTELKSLASCEGGCLSIQHPLCNLERVSEFNWNALSSSNSILLNRGNWKLCHYTVDRKQICFYFLKVFLKNLIYFFRFKLILRYFHIVFDV
jgi:hypothetical protein